MDSKCAMIGVFKLAEDAAWSAPHQQQGRSQKSRGILSQPAQLATIRKGDYGMSHCYIQPKTAKINRQPCRLEIAVSQTKQTPKAQINRKLSATSRKQFRHTNSSHCLFHQKALSTNPSNPRQLSSPPTRRTCSSAKKQQIRRSRLNPLGLYFLASYAQFSIGRQRALVHNRGIKVAAGYNDKNRAALVGLEPSREHQSVIRKAVSQRSKTCRGYSQPSMGRTASGS